MYELFYGITKYIFLIFELLNVKKKFNIVNVICPEKNLKKYFVINNQSYNNNSI